MLTIDEIRNIEFEKSIRGYKPEVVHEFLDQIAVQIDKLTKEKEDLEKKLYILAGKVEEYRCEEDMLKTAMINAQRMGENVIKEARQKADGIIREADLKAALIDEKAKEKQQAEEEILLSLQKKVTTFKSQILAIYKSHIESLSELPSLGEDKYIEEEDTNFPAFFVQNGVQIDEEYSDTLEEPEETVIESSEPENVNNYFTDVFQTEEAEEIIDDLADTERFAHQEEIDNANDDLNKLFGLNNTNFKSISLDDEDDGLVKVFEPDITKNKIELFDENEDDLNKEANENLFSGFFEDSDNNDLMEETEIEKPPIKSSIFEKFNGISFNE